MIDKLIDDVIETVNGASGLTVEHSIETLVQRIAGLLTNRGWKLVTAESCTGGLVAAACTELAGSSNWFERGIVSYSNAAKTQLLGVPEPVIAAHGAVSEPVVRAMAEGAVEQSRLAAASTVSIAITGIAGPTGGTADKPVGTVWFGWSIAGDVHADRQVFTGDRAAVRRASVQHALQVLADRLAAP